MKKQVTKAQKAYKKSCLELFTNLGKKIETGVIHREYAEALAMILREEWMPNGAPDKNEEILTYQDFLNEINQ